MPKIKTWPEPVFTTVLAVTAVITVIAMVVCWKTLAQATTLEGLYVPAIALAIGIAATSAAILVINRYSPKGVL